MSPIFLLISYELRNPPAAFRGRILSEVFTATGCQLLSRESEVISIPFSLAKTEKTGMFLKDSATPASAETRLRNVAHASCPRKTTERTLFALCFSRIALSWPLQRWASVWKFLQPISSTNTLVAGLFSCSVCWKEFMKLLIR